MTGAEVNAVVGVLRASRPSFRNGADKVAFALHASLLCRQYKLLAVGTEASCFEKVAQKNEEVDVDGWNVQDTQYAFAYVPEDRETARVVVKATVLGSALCVAALCEDSADTSGRTHAPVTAEFDLETYTREDVEGTSDVKAGYKLLDRLVARFGEMESTLRKQYDGSAEEAGGRRDRDDRGDDDDESRRTGGSTRPEPHYPPGHHGSPSGGAGGSLRRPWPPLVGADDLVPPGIRAPGMPGVGPFPDPMFGGPMRGSEVGPDDPLFGRRALGGRRSGHIPPSNLRIPPGARYDPIHPPGIPDPDFPGSGGQGPRIHPDIGPPGPGGSGGGMDFMFG